jgi:hypothetical protein
MNHSTHDSQANKILVTMARTGRAPREELAELIRYIQTLRQKVQKKDTWGIIYFTQG